MALIVIIVAIVVVVVIASPSPVSNPTRPPTLCSPSATETFNRYTSSTPSGMALIKSLFNEGAVFLAALNMDTGDSGETRNHTKRIAVVSAWVQSIGISHAPLQPCLGGSGADCRLAFIPLRLARIHGAPRILGKRERACFSRKVRYFPRRSLPFLSISWASPNFGTDPVCR